MEFEHARLADCLTLLVEHERDVDATKRAVADGGPCEGALGLGERQPLCRAHEGLGVVPIDLHAGGVSVVELLAQRTQERPKLVGLGERKIEHRHVLLELGWQRETRRRDHDAAVRVREGASQITKTAHHERVVEEDVHIAEQEEAGPLLAANAIEHLGGGRWSRQLGTAHALGDGEPARGRPHRERLSLPSREIGQQGFQAAFLVGHDVEHRVAGTDQQVELFHEACRCPGRHLLLFGRTGPRVNGAAGRATRSRTPQPRGRCGGA